MQYKLWEDFREKRLNLVFPTNMHLYVLMYSIFSCVYVTGVAIQLIECRFIYLLSMQCLF